MVRNHAKLDDRSTKQREGLEQGKSFLTQNTKQKKQQEQVIRGRKLPENQGITFEES